MKLEVKIVELERAVNQFGSHVDQLIKATRELGNIAVAQLARTEKLEEEVKELSNQLAQHKTGHRN